MYVCMNICKYKCIYVYNTYVCMYVCIYMYVYTQTYVYVYKSLYGLDLRTSIYVANTSISTHYAIGSIKLDQIVKTQSFVSLCCT